jgi:hypothetical protein
MEGKFRPVNVPLDHHARVKIRIPREYPKVGRTGLLLNRKCGVLPF